MAIQSGGTARTEPLDCFAALATTAFDGIAAPKDALPKGALRNKLAIIRPHRLQAHPYAPRPWRLDAEAILKALESAPPVATGSARAPAVSTGASDAKLHAAARQFEAMFMTEMLRLARPQSKAAGVFAQGQAEKSWQVLMDQALGQAATANGGTGLVRDIEKALRAAQNHSSDNHSGANQASNRQPSDGRAK